jgi:hypothetical protein
MWSLPTTLSFSFGGSKMASHFGYMRQRCQPTYMQPNMKLTIELETAHVIQSEMTMVTNVYGLSVAIIEFISDYLEFPGDRHEKNEWLGHVFGDAAVHDCGATTLTFIPGAVSLQQLCIFRDAWNDEFGADQHWTTTVEYHDTH